MSVEIYHVSREITDKRRTMSQAVAGGLITIVYLELLIWSAFKLGLVH